MRIFITGLAGFIGFHVAKALKARGDFVIGCDHFNAYYDPELKRQRAALLSEEGIEVVHLDICDRDGLERLLVGNEITHVLHLAAQAGVRHSIVQPQSYVRNNLDGFVQIVELIRDYPQIPLIYASSSSIYGMNKKIPFAESDTTDAPANLYGATKKANELIAQAYHHLFGISVTGLRYFTVYGPWGRPDMAYFSFSKAIAEGRPIQIYNEGKMKRDFTFIDDIVAGTIAAIDLSAKNEIFNLGHHRPEAIMHLVELLEQQLGKKAIIEYLPHQPGEVTETFADISKSQKLLGFHPKTSLETGITKFLEWYHNWSVVKASGR